MCIVLHSSSSIRLEVIIEPRKIDWLVIWQRYTSSKRVSRNLKSSKYRVSSILMLMLWQGWHQPKNQNWTRWLVEFFPESIINQPKLVQEIDLTPSWEVLIIKYLKKEDLPIHNKELRKLRINAARYTFVKDGELYKKRYMFPWLRSKNPNWGLLCDGPCSCLIIWRSHRRLNIVSYACPLRLLLVDHKGGLLGVCQSALQVSETCTSY